MARFNLSKEQEQKINNLAGGEAYRMSPELELTSILLTSFAQAQFYRSSDETFTRLNDVLQNVDPLFAAKAAIYARTEFGMRSISHVLAAELASYASGQMWAKSFYEQIVKRPDDMLEIIAYYFRSNKKLPNAMRKGFAAAFDKFDGYQIAKYRGKNKSVKLVDVLNLVRPVPTQRNAAALQALADGSLRTHNTWERELSDVGQKATTEQEKAEGKMAVWEELIRTNKLGYFALLRNLRNIALQAPNILPEALEQLTDRNRIKRSMVLPFRFLSAMDAVQNDRELTGKYPIRYALETAIDLSLDNVPRLPGKTLVVLDTSGSMTWNPAPRDSSISPIRIGALFATVLYKANQADLMTFSSEANYQVPEGKSTLGITRDLISKADMGGTNFHAIFEKADRPYDRIIILSDMQAWVGNHTPDQAYMAYRVRTGADPHIYAFDLQGYGSLQFKAHKIYQLAGFSEKVFDLMHLLEKDPNALQNAIHQVIL